MSPFYITCERTPPHPLRGGNNLRLGLKVIVPLLCAISKARPSVASWLLTVIVVSNIHGVNGNFQTRVEVLGHIHTTGLPNIVKVVPITQIIYDRLVGSGII
jgi:hypothetical protein